MTHEAQQQQIFLSADEIYRQAKADREAIKQIVDRLARAIVAAEESRKFMRAAGEQCWLDRL